MKNNIPAHVKATLQREKRIMARHAARRAESDLDNARQLLGNAAQKAAARNRRSNGDAILSGLRSVVTGVARSWGVGAPINISTNWLDNVTASTDFNSVTIRYPESAVPVHDEVGKFDAIPLRNLISDIKGLAYHEVGHVRFTTPFPTLCDIVGRPDMRMDVAMHRAWNSLEDQRMETAVVEESPVIARYFTVMVVRWILNEARRPHGAAYAQVNPEQFLLTAGRRYLPAQFRIDIRKAFTAKYGIDVTVEAETIIAAYKRATTPEELFENVLKFQQLLRRLSINSPQQGVDDHRSFGAAPKSRSAERERINSSASSEGEEEQQDEPEQPSNDTQSQGDEEGDDSADGDTAPDSDADAEEGEGDDAEEGEEADSSSQTSDSQQGSSDSDGQQDSPQQSSDGESVIDIPELEELMENLRQQDDSSVNDTIRDIHERANSDQGMLGKSVPTTFQNDDWKSQAEGIVSTLADALSIYTAEVAPIWQHRQTRGVIDTFAYRTRPSGSTEYRRLYDTSGDTGIDIAVTIMLDVSGSMEGCGEALGAAAYASKAACDSVGIPCTVTTFESMGKVLWNPEDSPEHLALQCDGGTNPTDLFEALEEQVYGKTKHIVVLMTDGQFGFKGCNYYRGDIDRYFVGLAYGAGASTESLQRLEFDSCYRIGDLLQVPQVLGEFLASYLR